MPKSTIDDVAELAGVSIKTVSRVVNNEPNVRDTTKLAVTNAIEKLNYRPNQSARNLASHRSRLIGLVYDDPSAYEVPSSGYVIKMQQGVLRACKSAHYELLIHPCNYRNKNVTQELKALIERVRPAGIVLAAPLSNMPKIVASINDTGTPLVGLSPGSKKSKTFSVSTNDREASAEMTRYLASLGHKKIAFIKGHKSHKAVHKRFLGYQDGLQESGLLYSERRVAEGDNSIGSGEQGAINLLSKKNRPTAIFAANDDMAAGVMRAAYQLNLKVPDELSIAGCDDITLAQQLYPALTTIRQPLDDMTETASLALIEATRNGKFKTGIEIVPAILKLRDSTGPAPT